MHWIVRQKQKGAALRYIPILCQNSYKRIAVTKFMNRGSRREIVQLMAVMLLALLIRLLAGRNSLTENGLLPSGYDDYYHLRRILYTVNHFPNTLWFDSYLDYPYGLDLTWPPLFDKLLAVLSLALGQHSQSGVEMISGFIPIVIGVLAVAVVYYMVKELFDSKVALLAAFMTALAPYYVLKTMLGAVDHHSLEVLLALLTLLFVILALVRREKRYLYAAGAGVMMAALAYTWLGANVYLGIFLIYIAVQLTLDLKDGVPSKETVTTLLTAFGVAMIFVLPLWNAPWLKPSFLGLAAIIAATLLLFAVSIFFARKKIHWAAYPLIILALASTFYLISMYMGGSFGFGAMLLFGNNYLFGDSMRGMIAEAEPLFYNVKTLSEVISSLIGINILISIMGLAALVLYIRESKAGCRQGRLLLFVWTISLLILTFGQVRFLYISDIFIGILISIFFFRVLDMAKRSISVKEQKIPAALPVVLLSLIILPTVIEAINVSGGETPLVEGDWYESLSWLRENSNSTSFYESPDAAPEYSVMSWWDYGNWILYLSKRPVVANNFQAGAEDSAKFYLSESEEAATALLDERKSRYILTDYSMFFDRLSALSKWVDEDVSSYIRLDESGPRVRSILTPRLFNTTMARLFLFDGAGTKHFRLIFESDTVIGNPPQSAVKIFEYVPGALIRVKASPDKRGGALLNMTSNQGRPFAYINKGEPEDGGFAVRVPYSTESRYGTHAIGSYMIFSGNENGVETQNLNVSEQDVLEGNTLVVNLT